LAIPRLRQHSNTVRRQTLLAGVEIKNDGFILARRAIVGFAIFAGDFFRAAAKTKIADPN
jgi:hypothetical protein